MLKIEKISPSITYIGAKDPDLKTFDIIMKTDFGSTYNSYLVDCGSEYVLIDTAKEHYFEEYFEELQKLCDINKIKYLIVNHTEPDHSGEIKKLLEKIPHLKIIASSCALGFLKDIANTSFDKIEVKEGFKINIGNKNFSFIIAPNLHWPDSMFTYIEEESFLFTCDVFGAHYCGENIYNDLVENKENYETAFKYYFDCIFAPFKSYVILGLNKLDFSKIKLICPSHGPIIRDNLKYYFDKYLTWSYEIPIKENKISIAYVSAYEYTKFMAEEISNELKNLNFQVVLLDLLETSIENAFEHILESEAFLIGSPTLNADTVPPIWDLILKFSPMGFKDKFAGVFGSYGWSGEAIRNIESRLAQVRCEVYRPGLKIKFNPNTETKLELIRNFGNNFGKKVMANRHQNEHDWAKIKTGMWKCLICGEIFHGEYPPKICPVCNAPEEQFVEINDDIINFQNNSYENIVIIGSGIASITAIEAIRARNKTVKISLVSEEIYYPYYKILLSKKIGEDLDENLIKDKNWFNENNIEIFLGKKVVKILRFEKKIILNDNSSLFYDKLIIASGSKSNSKKIHGDDKMGVFSLRTRKDFEEINSFLKKDYVKDIVLLGGGILSLEIADRLKDLNKNITIIETGPRLMPKQLDQDASSIFNKILENSKINIFLSEGIDEIYGTGNNYGEVCGIKLSHSARKINCQMIIQSLGNISDLSLFKDTGLNLNRGIMVDEFMRSSDENIYAIGDIAEFEGKMIGLWPRAIEMAKVAGANIVGDNSKKFKDMPIASSFNGFETKIFSIGEIGNSAENSYSVLELKDPKLNIYKKFYFKDNLFVGGILMGDISKSIQLRKAINAASTIQHFLDMHFLDEI